MPSIDYYGRMKVNLTLPMNAYVSNEAPLNDIAKRSLFEKADEIKIYPHGGLLYRVVSPDGQSIVVDGKLDAFVGVHNGSKERR